MSERLIVVGGDAAGMSAASQARRQRKPDDLEIIAFERSSFVSYSACGEPYYVGGYIPDIGQLQARTPEEFAAQGITVHTRHEVIALDPKAGRLTVRNLATGTEETVGYDLLMYATGATAFLPPIAGLDLAGVHILRTLDDALAVRRLLTQGARQAVVVGGGYIGLEVAEAFHHQGVKTRVLTMELAVLDRTLDPDMGALVTERMRSMGIEVHTGIEVHSLEGKDGHIARVDCPGGTCFEADVVVLGLGTRPEVQLAQEAGISLGETGAVAVNARQQTRLEGVWAAGDCAEALHRVSQRAVNIHLGTIANKQGRVAGINLGGGYATFPGVLGTAITKVCELEIARTGLTEAEATAAGLAYGVATLDSTTTTGYWPEADTLRIKVLAERGTGRLLGAQIVGGRGAGKRIDVFATALWNNMRADDMIYLDLSYAPPFASVWEPVLVAARHAWEASR
ncbi:MAG: FAD-dependent oxidoreductase [Candidatus Tectomicrobia bacterium]|uniref:FAD-dependent oxidoreductase n=1 Tax=Tectimicrobiota bacterium TaxID=2528274 RepID=A0A932CMS6_UNCTE|nr:FAD-dependent oxidoreductase [Candidatus Tectomicrobia bacterium]